MPFNRVEPEGFQEVEEAQRNERVFAGSQKADGGNEGCGVCADEVKLERAQGECLGIRSRRRS